MTLALSIIGGFVLSHLVAAWVFGRAILNAQREHDRRYDLILNQLLHATGKTWQPPPADQQARPEPLSRPSWTQSPEAFDWSEPELDVEGVPA